MMQDLCVITGAALLVLFMILFPTLKSKNGFAFGARKQKDVAFNSLFWAMPDLSNYVARRGWGGGGQTEVGKAS